MWRSWSELPSQPLRASSIASFKTGLTGWVEKRRRRDERATATAEARSGREREYALARVDDTRRQLLAFLDVAADLTTGRRIDLLKVKAAIDDAATSIYANARLIGDAGGEGIRQTADRCDRTLSMIVRLPSRGLQAVSLPPNLPGALG